MALDNYDNQYHFRYKGIFEKYAGGYDDIAMYQEYGARVFAIIAALQYQYPGVGKLQVCPSPAFSA